MCGTKTIARYHRETCGPSAGPASLRVGLILLCAMFLAAPGTSARAQRLPLPPEEQAAVDRAIERGVKFLKGSAQKKGTWARFNAPHPFGYTALPALTLLECGVPADDPIIQRAAHGLRMNAARLNETYELSLTILFLDRLGNSKDRELIQTLALRLVAGQSATGGWGYKCPVLGSRAEKELLTVLRKLPSPLPVDMRDIAAGPGAMPAITEGKDRKPANLGPIAKAPGVAPLEGTPTTSSAPSLSGTSTSGSPGASLYPQETTSLAPSLWRDWLGFSNFDGKGLKAGPLADGLDDKPERKDDKLPPAPPAPRRPKEARPDNDKAAEDGEGKPLVIPERLHRLAVLQDPDTHVLVDPIRRSHDLFLTTTDNSNTQFAILALWTAQRHGVPMIRSLNLIVRRYVTSQNPDGTWSYRYRFGGGRPWGPAMTCVGLIGLAVGHGLAHDGPGGKPVKDPRILNGLAALSRSVGTPTGQMLNQPMQSLYYLWSLERVAVLYNLPLIGDKDWYRWGAEILVANQQLPGNWARGGYPGSHPTIDTCLALLFLKRANLVKDLTSRLPFNPADLNQSVLAILSPSAPPSATPQQPTQTMTLPDAPPKPAAPSPPRDDPSPKLPTALDATPTMQTAQTNPPAAPEESMGGDSRRKWIVASLALFVVLAGGSLFFLLASRRTKESEADKKTKASRGKRKSAARK